MRQTDGGDVPREPNRLLGPHQRDVVLVVLLMAPEAVL